MRKDHTWILNALYNDDTKIRNTLSTNLWNEIGATSVDSSGFYGYHTEYVEVFMDEHYLGLYSLMEPIDNKQLNLGENSGEYLYKRYAGIAIDENTFDIEEGSVPSLESIGGFEIKGRLSNITINDWTPLRNAISFMNEPSDEQYAKKAIETIDMDNCLNVWMFLEAVNGFDNKTKNMYYVYRLTNTGDYRMSFVPWDLDLTWGYVYTEENELFSRYDENRSTKHVEWQPGQRLYELNVNQAQSIVAEKWQKLRQSTLSDEHIAALIRNDQDLLVHSGAMKRDEVRWGDSPHTYDCSYLIEYAQNHLSYLDEQFLIP